jgi:hypothetical protein
MKKNYLLERGRKQKNERKMVSRKSFMKEEKRREVGAR